MSPLNSTFLQVLAPSPARGQRFGTPTMDDLAPSSDQQDAEDWMYSPAPAPPGRQLEQVKEGTEQQAPSPVQQPDADEPSLPTQASAQAFDDSDSTEVSFEDTIRNYIPDESDLALSLQQRHTFAWIVNESWAFSPPKHRISTRSTTF